MSIVYILLGVVHVLLTLRSGWISCSHLGEKSFSVQSSVVYYKSPNGASTYRIETKWLERYSIEQRRSILEYNKGHVNALKSGKLLYDWRTKLLVDTGLNHKVYEGHPSQFIEHIGIADFQLADDDDIDEIIIGSARLLIYVEKFRDKMQLLTTNNEEESVNPKVRGIDAMVYKFSHRNRRDEDLEFTIYYARSWLKHDKESQPLRISVANRNKWKMIADFMDIQLIQKQLDATIYSSASISYNDFCFDVLDGLSRSLKPERIISKEKKVENSRFSFEAHVEAFEIDGNKVAQPYIYYVAFDGSLKSIRVDVSSHDDSHVSHQIMNFKLNRIHEIVEKNDMNPLRYGLIDMLTGAQKSPYLLDAMKTKLPDGTYECISTRISDLSEKAPSLAISESVSRLLLGADEFTYMGLAKVRGIDALVYEAVSSQSTFPVWLDPPVAFRDDKGKMRTRDAKGAKNNIFDVEKRFQTLVFVAAGVSPSSVGGSNADASENPKVLAIELYEMQSSFSVIRKRSVSLNNFAWDLEDQAPNGDQVTDLFSIGNYGCLASVENPGNQWSRIHMFLAREMDDRQADIIEDDETRATTYNTAKSQIPRVLQNRGDRNLALMSALQSSFNLPITMVQDFESRLIRPKTVRSAEDNKSGNSGEDSTDLLSSLLVNFRLATHDERLATPVYLGMGIMSSEDYSLHVSILDISFLRCFLTAAHNKVDLNFGYHPKRRKCVIALQPISNQRDEDGKEKINLFKVSEQLDWFSQFEVYKVSREGRSMGKNWVDEWTFLARSFTGSSLYLGVNDDDDNNNKTEIKFEIKKFVMDGREDSTTRTLRRIAGFTIPETSRGLGRSVKLSEEGKEEDDETKMTFDLCKSACLEDLKCNSFSVCVQSTLVMDCVTSELDFFGSAELTEKLEEFASKRTKKNFTSILKNREYANGIEVELTRKFNCNTYAKNKLDYFEPSIMFVDQTVKDKKMYPVASLQECAELCVAENIQIFESSRGKNDDEDKKFAINEDDSTTIRKLLAMQKERSSEIARQVCNRFHYIDRSELVVLPKGDRLISAWEKQYKATSSSVQEKEKEESKGFCSLRARTEGGEKEVEEDDAANTKDRGLTAITFIAEVHHFRFEIFYEKRAEVSLVESVGAPDLKHLREGKDLESEENLKLLRKFFERSDNFQQVIFADLSRCAATCFAQSESFWPTCQSFDIQVDERTQLSICTINSISLRSAMANDRSDLIRFTKSDESDGAAKPEKKSKAEAEAEADVEAEGKEEQQQRQNVGGFFRVWHYELRVDSASSEDDQSPVSRWSSLMMDELWTKIDQRPNAARNFALVLGSFFCVGLGLAAGVTIGWRITKSYAACENTSRLISKNATSVEFVNNVNYEGRVRDHEY